MNAAILITGATGNVGSEIVKILLKLDVPFRAAIRKNGDENKVGLSKEDCVTFDFLDARTFEPTFEGIKAVFLMRPPDLANPEKEINPAIQAAKKAGVKRIVFMSLLGAEKNFFVPHHKIEKIIAASGISYTFLRPSFFMQNLSGTHAHEIKAMNEILVPAGRGKTSFIDARDIAAVAVEVLTQAGFENKALPLTGPAALNYLELAEILTQELGRPITYSNPSVLRFIRAMRKRHFKWAYIAVMSAIYTVNKLGLAARLTPDVEQILGRKPISFQQFAKDYRDAWL